MGGEPARSNPRNAEAIPPEESSARGAVERGTPKQATAGRPCLVAGLSSGTRQNAGRRRRNSTPRLAPDLAEAGRSGGIGEDRARVSSRGSGRSLLERG